MSAEIIDLAAARKARHTAKEGPGRVRLMTLQEWTEAIFQEGWQPQGSLPRWPGGIDDLEV